MSIATVSSLVEVLRQYRLLEASQLDELQQSWLAKFPEPRALARELLQRGWLTAYQVNQLFQGKAAELVLGGYVLLERIGEGGMGLVFKARHQKLGRIVALKIIRQDRLSNPEALYRFKREILATAQLSHPNVVHSYDADQIGDRHLIAMEYVDGVDLGRLIREQGPLPVADACEYIRQAALGLQHAFEHNLVHRDIKPSNLLLTRPVPPGSGPGVIKLLDLGLARIVKDDDEASMMLTQAGALVGTPDFISPEQARNAHHADIRSDIYSLGCTLFFLLTGQPPFQGGSMTEKLLKHHWDAPPTVQAYRPDAPAIIAALLRKQMAKRPEERFQTPAELAAALARVLAPGGFDLPVPPEWTGFSTQPDVPPPSAIPVTLPTLSDALLPQALLTTPTSHDATEELLARSATPVATPVAVSVAAPSRRLGLVVLGAAGGGLLLGALLLVVLLWSSRAPTEATRVAATRPLVSVADQPSPLDKLNRDRIPPADRIAGQPKELAAVLGEHRGRHFGPVRGIAFQPDGAVLASAGLDGAVRLWDPATLQARGVLRGNAGAPLLCLAYAPNGKTLATGDWNGRVRLWDLTRTPPREGSQVRHGDASVTSLSFSGDGAWLAAGLDDGTIQLWELQGAAEPRKGSTLRGHMDAVGIVAFAPRELLLASGSQDHTVRLWDLTVPSPKTRAVLEGHTDTVGALAFTTDGGTLVTGGDDQRVRLWNLNPKQPVLRGAPLEVESAVSALAFSGSGNVAFCAMQNGHIAVFDLRGSTPKQRGQVEDATSFVGLAWSGKGQLLAAGTTGGVVRVWDYSAGNPREVAPPKGHTAPVASLAFTPDGQTLVSGGLDGGVRLWDVNGLEPNERALLQLDEPVASVAFSPDGNRLAVGCAADRIIRLWDLPATVPRTWPSAADEKARAGAVAFGRDNRLLIVAGRDGPRDGTVRLWDVQPPEPAPLHVFRGHVGKVVWLATGQQGQLAATACDGDDQSVRLWDVVNKREVHRFHGAKNGTITALALAPDGGTLAFANTDLGNGNDDPDHAVRLWDLKASPPRQLPPLPGHANVIRGLGFAADSKTLATADDDGRLVLWNLETNKNLQDWRMPGGVATLQFAPDTRHLAIGNTNGTVYILRLRGPTARATGK
ncbi:MAG: serine/threonine protein kinase [Planctomycetia bacterium]|nr:serine/threonine protein kinase [Planctomycetia bacterium]